MHRLSREIRFSLVRDALEQIGGRVLNGFAGHPPGGGEIAPFLVLRITLAGPLDPASGFVRNIVEIDATARRVAIPLAVDAAANRIHPAVLTSRMFAALADEFPGSRLDELSLFATPYIRYTHGRGEPQQEPMMMRLSQKFEFSASHRLHNPALSAEENLRCYGKCNNPHGHGHNYELEVTVRCGETPAADPAALGRIVHDTVLARFDHRYLNVEVPPFDTVIPGVENIARVIYGMLKGPLAGAGIELASVTVWETAKTWCQYTDEPDVLSAASEDRRAAV